MAELTVRGSFVWHELMTTDIAAAAKYYQKVIGWKTQPFEQDPSYLMWVAKNGPLGGVMQLAAGVASYWLPYVGTADIEATVNSATTLGGTVVVPVTNLAHGGRYAVLADPLGAHFGVYWSANAMPAGMPQLGEFGWHELATSDYQAAFAFYQALFGWEKTGEHDMGEMGIYYMFGLNGHAMGGIFNKPPGMPAAWCCYALVADTAKTAKTAAAAGGTVCNGPMQVPGGTWIAQISDPQGAMHAVMSPPPATASAAATVKQASPKKASKKKSTKKKSAKKKPAAAKSKTGQKAAKKQAPKKKVAKSAKKKVARKSATKKKLGKRKVASKKLQRGSKAKVAKAKKKQAKKKPMTKRRKVAKRKK